MATVIGISVGADGTICCVDSAGFVYQLDEDPWEWKRHSTAKDVKEVAVGSAANIWCRNGSGELFRLQGSDWNGSWKKDTVASDVVTVSVGTDGTVWVGNKNGKLVKRSGADWRENPHASDAKEVTVGDAGHVWCRNGAGKVFKLQGSGWNGSWVEDTQASWVQSISAASDGTVWLASANPADKDRLFKREGPNNWKKDATGKAIQVSTSAADKVICVDAGGAIFSLKNGNWVNYYGLDVNAVWIVEEGETLSSKIQDLFGLRGAELTARVDEVAAKNGIVDKDKIDVGDVILLD